MIFALLLIFWIILNGKISLEIVLLGLILSMLVSKFSYSTIRLTRELEKKIFFKFFKIIEYLLILFVEIIKANVDIIRLVLTKNPELTPTLKTIEVDLRSRISRVALANSITLTPGTITVKLEDNRYLIHAIKKSNLDGIEESIFVEKLKELEGDHGS